MPKKSLIACATTAAILAFALPTAAAAQSGGLSGGGGGATATSADPTFYDLPFGARDLSYGMAGTDVKTLNWALRGLALGTPPSASFADTTDGAVRSLQASAGIGTSGVVDKPTRKALAGRMRNQRASWYGPGLFGNRTACGKKLRKGTMGVAHRKLPCGTKVTFAYKGRWVRAKVIDRGPFVKGRKWDLTYQVARQLGTLKAGSPKVKAVAAP